MSNNTILSICCAECDSLQICFDENYIGEQKYMEEPWEYDVVHSFFVLFNHCELVHKPDNEVDFELLSRHDTSGGPVASGKLMEASKVFIPLRFEASTNSTSTKQLHYFVLVLLERELTMTKLTVYNYPMVNVNDAVLRHLQPLLGQYGLQGREFQRSTSTGIHSADDAPGVVKYELKKPFTKCGGKKVPGADGATTCLAA